MYFFFLWDEKAKDWALVFKTQNAEHCTDALKYHRHLGKRCSAEYVPSAELEDSKVVEEAS